MSKHKLEIDGRTISSGLAPKELPAATEEQAPDRYCVTTADGDCISEDSRCMHQAGVEQAEPVAWQYKDQEGNWQNCPETWARRQTAGYEIRELFAPPPAPSDGLREARLYELLDNLQAAEATYRDVHDHAGAGALVTGRAWKQLRQAGDLARTALPQEKP